MARKKERERDHDKDDALFKEYNDRFAWKMRREKCMHCNNG